MESVSALVEVSEMNAVPAASVTPVANTRLLATQICAPLIGASVAESRTVT
jgi:hypothetical protein